MLIKRAVLPGGHGVFGEVYTEDGEPLCYSVERGWANNRPYASCVPSGTYDLETYRFHRGGYDTFVLVNPELNVFRLQQVKKPNARFACCFHRANFPYELLGCVAPVTQITYLWSEKIGRELLGGKGSKRALERLLQYLNDTGDSICTISSIEAV